MSGRETADLEGIVLDIQRMSTEDGPGIRTTVFMKGCTLGCAWCHNPESINPRPQLQWIGSRCIGCHACLTVCPRGALSDGGKGIVIDREACDGCGICAAECPSTALEMLGERWSVERLVEELLKDRVYFEKSGGGITVGGGESTYQADFVSRLLHELKSAGVHTAIDTCGHTSKKALDIILPSTDLVLYDLKEIDSERHREYTGAGNEKILENLLHIRDFMIANGNPSALWIRTPIIPGMTDREDNIRGIGEFLAGRLADVFTRWELLAFNNLCEDKYTRLGREWIFKKNMLMTDEDMEKLRAAAVSTGLNPEKVTWTGATRLEEGVQRKEPAGQEKLRLVKGNNYCSPRQ